MKACLTLCFLLLPAVVLSQTWTYTTPPGPQEDMFDFRNGCALVYPAPKDDVLSAWQTLPFAWTFGETAVDGYFISDNGYITFDPAATVSEPDNAAANVRNAIFGFWDDLFLEEGHSMWSNEVRTKTAGVAPNRSHLIMWVSAVPKGSTWSSANISFAIVLYEQGGFEITQIAGRPARNMSGSIGAVSADGSVETLLAGSPNLEYPALTADPTDDMRYVFTWSQSALDAAVERIDVPAIVRVNDPVSIAGTIMNKGSETISSFRVAYSIDGTAEQEMFVDGLTLRTNDSHQFVHPVRWTPTEAGRNHTLALRVYDVNGTEDDQPANDTLTTSVFTRLGVTSPKRVLVEEFTGAWCGWCPDGMLQIERLRLAHPDAVTYAIHAGGNDAMIIPEGAELAQTFTPAYPTAMIDRVFFAGEKGVAIQRTSEAWITRTGHQAATFTPLSVSVNAYRTDPRYISASVEVYFSDYAPPGDYRVHCVLVHDKLKGSGSGWDQLNYFSGNATYPNHPFYSQSNPVTNFEHRHVLAASATGAWGDSTLLPSMPQAVTSFSKAYTFTYPTPYADGDVHVVAFVTRHGASTSTREVLNAGQSTVVPVSVSNLPASEFRLGDVYPQPADNAIRADVSLANSGPVRAEVFDLLGRLRFSSDYTFPENNHGSLQVPTASLRSGTYLLRLTAGARVAHRSFVVSR